MWTPRRPRKLIVQGTKLPQATTLADKQPPMRSALLRGHRAAAHSLRLQSSLASVQVHALPKGSTHAGVVGFAAATVNRAAQEIHHASARGASPRTPELPGRSCSHLGAAASPEAPTASTSGDWEVRCGAITRVLLWCACMLAHVYARSHGGDGRGNGCAGLHTLLANVVEFTQVTELPMRKDFCGFWGCMSDCQRAGNACMCIVLGLPQKCEDGAECSP